MINISICEIGGPNEGRQFGVRLRTKPAAVIIAPPCDYCAPDLAGEVRIDTIRIALFVIALVLIDQCCQRRRHTGAMSERVAAL